MKYSLRSLMIVVLVLPPLLAGLWTIGSIAVAQMRLRHDDPWEDVGGPGSIAEFSTDIGCAMGQDENESPPEPKP